MTTQAALQLVADHCQRHKQWLTRAIENPKENDELKAELNGYRLGGLEELDSVIDYIHELQATLRAKEAKHGEADA